MVKRIIFLLGNVFVFSGLFAQNFGGNPASIKWRQINTNAVRIVFPKGLDSVANRVATLTEALNNHHRTTVGNRFRKVDIILNANNTLSNAFVQLGPYRSEYYLTQPQNPFSLGSLGWADNLAIHEFRHVQQYNNYNVGFSKFAGVLLGQQGRAVANAISIPDWFFEGDAVWNETALSQQGRGRLSFFFNAYKSLHIANKQYSFMKLRNGSLQNFVPNHYDLGYLLVAYGREKYGDTVWNKITDDAARFKGVFYPFQKAVKRNINMEYNVFVDSAIAYFKEQWDKEKTIEPQWLTLTERNNVVNYKYAYPCEDGGIVALKNSYKQIPFFIKLDSQFKEQKIAVRDINYDDYFSYRNGKIIYAALQPDRRWGSRDYSIIRLINMSTGDIKTITSKTKFFSPDINNVGNQVVVVEADPGKNCLLHIIDLDGKMLQSFTADSTLFYSHPKFSTDGNFVFVVARRQNGKMGLLEWQWKNNQFRWLLAPANRIIGFPIVSGNRLFFTESSGGKDGICQIDLPDGLPVKLVSYPTGIYQGFVINNQVVGSVFTADGYRLGCFPISNNNISNKLTEHDQLTPLYVDKTLQQHENINALSTKTYRNTKYPKSFHLFNFHSWRPEPDGPNYKFSLLGENVLGTLSSKLSYTYNINERSHKLGYTGIYGGSYINPFIDVNQTWSREIRFADGSSFFYNETDAAFGLQLPLNLSFGKQYRFLTLQSSINTERVKWTGVGKDLFQNINFNYTIARLSYSSQIQKAVQHIYPRFAQTLLADYRTIVNKYKAHQLLLSGSLYLPGISTNHNLVLTAAFQNRDTLQQYIFDNSFPFPHGYININFPRMWQVGINYHIPLCYPDWGFGNLLYLQRLRLNLFCNYTQGQNLRTNIMTPFSSAGTELYFDTKVWNQLPVSIGVRYSRLLNKEFRKTTNANLWEIVLPVNLY